MVYELEQKGTKGFNHWHDMVNFGYNMVNFGYNMVIFGKKLQRYEMLKERTYLVPNYQSSI